MDIELAKTFLILAEEGSFKKTAERLQVTQSTISARIQTLESFLGTQVFIRGKTGVFFTKAGLDFKKYAEDMIDSWFQVKQKISSLDYQDVVNCGYENAVSSNLILNLTSFIKTKMQDTSLLIKVNFAEILLKNIFESKLDFAVMLSPYNHIDIENKEIAQEKLILVSSAVHNSKINNYVAIDWGKEFRLKHSLAFPEFENAKLFFNQSSLGLEYLLTNDACGYFPESMITRYLDDKLFIIEKAPIFKISIYLAYLKKRQGESVIKALEDF